jgi:LysM repeat protein
LSLRLERSGGTLGGAAIVATLVVTLAAVMLALLPSMAEARTEGKSTPSVVVRPGDSLWSISQERLAPNATPQRVAEAAERIHALNRGRIGADPDLIFVGQELSLPPALSERPTGASAARKSAPAADAGERDRTARGTTGSKATGKAPRTAAGGAAAEGGDVPAPVAERQAEPVSLPLLPDEVAAAPVPAVRTLASNDSSPSPVASVLRTIRTEFTSAASWLADSFAGARTDGRRLLGLGVLLLTLVVAALVAWKLPMRRTTRQDAERWGIPTGYYHGAPVAHRNDVPFASRPGSPGDLGREEAGRKQTPEPLAPEQRGVPTGNGFTPVANGARNAAATTSATTSVLAARRVRKAKPKAKPKAWPRNGLALGAHNPGVRSASLLARVPARRARKLRTPSRAARLPLVPAPEQKRRGAPR